MASNMTHREFFHLHGYLPEERIEDLLSQVDSPAKAVKEVQPYIEEAMGQYPAEDFLSGPIGRLQELAKRIRGDNRAEAQAIAEALDDIAQCTFYASEHGRDELSKALKDV